MVAGPESRVVVCNRMDYQSVQAAGGRHSLSRGEAWMEQTVRRARARLE